MTDLQSMFSNAIQSIQTRIAGNSNYPLVTIKSTVDNREYTVRDMPDKQRACDLMASVRKKIEKQKEFFLTTKDAPELKDDSKFTSFYYKKSKWCN